jgi:hypothetical protein
LLQGCGADTSDMWSTVRVYVRLVVMAVVVCAAAAWLPGWLTRVQVPDEYDDLKELVPFETYWLRPAPYATGHIVVYRFGPADGDIGFARVAAVAGDTIELRAGKLLVSGTAYPGWNAAANQAYPPAGLGPVVVPAGHLFVLSNKHHDDSTVNGMLGAAAVLGRIRE